MSTSELPPRSQPAATAARPANPEQPEEEPYEPWKHRNVRRPLGFIGSMLHMLKGSLGTGILAMPLAFRNGGLWVGLVGVILFGILYTHCVHIMIKCSQVLCERIKEPTLAYSQVAETAFKTGHDKIKKFTWIVKQGIDISLFMDYYFCCVVYILFTASTLYKVIGLEMVTDEDTGNEKPEDMKLRMVISGVTACMLPLGLISNLKYLVPFSCIAIFTLSFGCGFVLYDFLKELPPLSSRPAFTSVFQFTSLMSTVIFAMDGIGTVLPIENDMKDPSKMLGCPGILNISMGYLIVAYSTLGFLGYLRYGDEVKGTITLNLESSFMGEVVRMMVTINVFLSFGLFFYVICGVIWKRIESKVTDNNRCYIYYGMRVVLTIIAGAFAALVPNLEIFIGIVGSICASTVILLFPPIIEMATFWDDKAYMGPFRWKIFKNIIILVIWIITLVSGVIESVDKIGKIYSKDENKNT